jgi:hypothetical protein
MEGKICNPLILRFSQVLGRVPYKHTLNYFNACHQIHRLMKCLHMFFKISNRSVLVSTEDSNLENMGIWRLVLPNNYSIVIVMIIRYGSYTPFTNPIRKILVF